MGVSYELVVGEAVELLEGKATYDDARWRFGPRPLLAAATYDHFGYDVKSCEWMLGGHGYRYGKHYTLTLTPRLAGRFPLCYSLSPTSRRTRSAAVCPWEGFARKKPIVFRGESCGGGLMLL